jgi:hypothetical protein
MINPKIIYSINNPSQKFLIKIIKNPKIKTGGWLNSNDPFLKNVSTFLIYTIK